MRLRHIEVFHAIMQAGTVSGTAQVLHISRPAVTLLTASHAPLSHGARALADCIGAAARRLIDRGSA